MTNRATLEALLARVLEGTGPDRAIDKAILASMGFTWRGMAYWHHDEKTMWRGKTFFTASLDNALTLVPEGWAWSVSGTVNRVYHARIAPHADSLKTFLGYWFEAKSAPRALIAACLKARMEELSA